MSWWDTSGITSLASQALKNAQKKIDKVLDIEEEDRERRRKMNSKKTVEETDEARETTPGGQEEQGGDFWSTWMSPGSSGGDKESREGSQSPSSWSLPWQTGEADPAPTSPTASTQATAAEKKLRLNRQARSERAVQRKSSTKMTVKKEDEVESEGDSSEHVVEDSQSFPEKEPQNVMTEVIEESQTKHDIVPIKSESRKAEEALDVEISVIAKPEFTKSEKVEDEIPTDDLSSEKTESILEVVQLKDEQIEVVSDEIPNQTEQVSASEDISEKEDESVQQDPAIEEKDIKDSEPEAKQDFNTASVVEETWSGSDRTGNEQKDNDWNDVEFDAVPTESELDIVLREDAVQAKETEDEPPVSDQKSVDNEEDLGEVLSSVLTNVEDKISHFFFSDDSKTSEETSSAKVEQTAVESGEQNNEAVCDKVPAVENPSTAIVEHSISQTEANEEVRDTNVSNTPPCSQDSEIVPDQNCMRSQMDNLAPKQDSEALKESSSSSFSELMEESASEASFLSTSSLVMPDKPVNSNDKEKDHSQSNMVFEKPSSTEELNSDIIKTCEMESVTDSSSVIVSQESEHEPTVLKPLMDLSQEYVNISSATGSLNSSQNTSTLLADSVRTSSETDLANSRTSSDLDLPTGRHGSTGSSDTSRFDSSMDTVVDRSVCEVSRSSVEEEEHPETRHPLSLFGMDPSGQEDKEVSDQDVGSVDSSDVKDMLEEAMKESNKTEDSGSDNHSNGEKSESSKLDSEHEKSGQESSDDIETTTSSDIEIIQAPNGAGGCVDGSKFHSGFDLSPLKLALQKTAGGHRRSDSQSSSSAHSKVGELEHLSPDRGDNTHWREDDGVHHDLHSVREEDADSPYHPERLLKKLADMAEVLQARETKLVELSKENHQLMEDKSILHSQLQQVEELREAETADLTALTDEFTVRLSESEKKIQGILKEKESLKQQLTAAEKELKKRAAKSDVEALLEEKTEQVEELLREGEKLSKQQLQSSTIIKKLRAKEKETESTISSQKKKLEEQNKELERLRTVLDSRSDMEKKQSDAITQLNAAVQSQNKELSKLKNDLEDAQEKNRGMQSALDSSYKEIAELHRSHASHDSRAQEAALSAETQVREELKAAMDREQQRFKLERETFIIQIDDLRLDMTRLEKEHSRREELLRQEIAHLQQRHQEDESRSQELTQSVTSATRPLLRQIENLQANYGAQATAWEKVEKSLTDRLAECQTSLAMAQEKERSASERLMEVSARLSSLEATCARLKQEKAQLAAQLDTERGKLDEMQDVRLSVIAQLESGKQKMSEELNQLKVDKVQLESELNTERIKTDNERRKAAALEEQLRLVERDRPKSRGTPSPSPSMSVSRQESLSGSFYEGQSPGWSWSYHEDQDSVTGAMPKGNMYDTLRHSGAAIVVENLQSQLKLKEGETTQLQSEIAQLERTRESMARELVDLTYKNEELEENKLAHDRLKKEYEELNSRYSALLQMYGEKEEQVQELRLDLQDVKEMYKSQIDALMAQ